MRPCNPSHYAWLYPFALMQARSCTSERLAGVVRAHACSSALEEAVLDAATEVLRERTEGDAGPC